MSNSKVRMLVSVSMLSALSYLLTFIKFPLPVFPDFLTIDFSDIPAMIGAFIFGPLAGTLVLLIKNIINYITTGSPVGFPVGQVANFVAGMLYVMPMYYIYRHFKGSKRGLLVGIGTGTLAMTLFMSLFNYIILLPLYLKLLNFDLGVSFAKAVVVIIMPFNLIKGVLVGYLFMLMFGRLKKWIERQQLQR
ncbi:ECF transporter S component [Brochothrix thermosphacta]|uniref:ECF transporter S component n=1 Tax=Brochothrix thermosphacta TaxID=2756 RepID=UPI0039B10090